MLHANTLPPLALKQAHIYLPMPIISYPNHGMIRCMPSSALNRRQQQTVARQLPADRTANLPPTMFRF